MSGMATVPHLTDALALSLGPSAALHLASSEPASGSVAAWRHRWPAGPRRLGPVISEASAQPRVRGPRPRRLLGEECTRERPSGSARARAPA